MPRADLLGPLEPNSKLTIDVRVRLDIATSDAGRTSVANLSIPPSDVAPVETSSTAYWTRGTSCQR